MNKETFLNDLKLYDFLTQDYCQILGDRYNTERYIERLSDIVEKIVAEDPNLIRYILKNTKKKQTENYGRGKSLKF